MAFFSMSLVKGLLALQICVVVMVGSFDSTSFIGVQGFETEAGILPKPIIEPPSPMPRPKLRNRIAVEGMAYCKSCKYEGVDTLLEAVPLAGAVVKLQCNSSRHPVVAEGKTDPHGYFFIQPPKVSSGFGAPRCKVFLVSSPLAKCKQPTNLNGGVSGASLRFRTVLVGPPHTALYSVGPFAFEPFKASCHR